MALVHVVIGNLLFLSLSPRLCRDLYLEESVDLNYGSGTRGDS